MWLAKKQKLKLMDFLYDNDLDAIENHLAIATQNPEFLKLLKQPTKKKWSYVQKKNHLVYAYVKSNEAFNLLRASGCEIQSVKSIKSQGSSPTYPTYPTYPTHIHRDPHHMNYIEPVIGCELIKNSCLSSFHSCLSLGLDVNQQVQDDSLQENNNFFQLLLETFDNLRWGLDLFVSQHEKIDGYDLIDCVRNLVTHGFDANLILGADHSNRPLTKVMHYFQIELISPTEAYSIIELLLDSEADVNFSVETNKSFFSHAAKLNRASMVDFLLAYYKSNRVQLGIFQQEMHAWASEPKFVIDTDAMLGHVNNDTSLAPIYLEKVNAAIEAANLTQNILDLPLPLSAAGEVPVKKTHKI